MIEEDVNKFNKKLRKLDWKIMLLIQFILSLLIGYVYLTNLNVSTITIYQLIQITLGFIFGIFFIFGGYYFTKIFFKTNLSFTQFYKLLTYVNMPILIGILLLLLVIPLIMDNSTMMGSFFLISLLFFILFIIIGILFPYYFFKGLVTLLYLCKKEFNATAKNLIVINIVWVIFIKLILTIIISLFFG